MEQAQNNQKRIRIAIDGYAGCGKSTLARHLAQALEYIFIDTGAMYRSVAFLSLNQFGNVKDSSLESIVQANPYIQFEPITNSILVNGLVLENEIRSQQVVQVVSDVASNTMVRNYMTDLQRKFANISGVVMEGRDIGTVVMPAAELKLFVTASIETRVNRRLKQILSDGKYITSEEVRNNLENRDHKDSTRSIAPLALAEDAIAIDTSNLSIEDQLHFCLALVKPLTDSAELLRFVRH